jgi:hypothetical protein
VSVGLTQKDLAVGTEQLLVRPPVLITLEELDYPEFVEEGGLAPQVAAVDGWVVALLGRR